MSIDSSAVKMLGIPVTRRVADSLVRTAEAVVAKLTYAQLDRFRIGMDLNRPQFASMVHVSERTLVRYADDEKRRVDPGVAERALRVARIQALAEFVLEDPANARAWLHAPQPAVGGRRPIDMLGSEFGAREVEHVLQRIEHGVYM
jgi:putative toxin-antitoxin system antitoxin component (TIGR02293 family)